ncbi:MAG: SIMPL domain-containing protein [Planctomycetes bacterium]|nr:SIMPL domain-containing protein [Planctomycetota bacterium]
MHEPVALGESGSPVPVPGPRRVVPRRRAWLPLALLLATACSERPSIAALAPQPTEVRQTRTIEVAGTGVMVGAPRTATFDMLIETWAPRSAEAWKDLSVLAKRVSVAVRKAGVRGTDVTEHVIELEPALHREVETNPSPEPAVDSAALDPSVEDAPADPLGDWSAYPPDAAGYVARQTFTIVHRDPDKLGRALSNGMRVGGVRVLDLVVTPNNSEVLLERARQRAAQDAKERAEILAQELGMQVAQPQEIEELLSIAPGDDRENPLMARVELRVVFSLRSN